MSERADRAMRARAEAARELIASGALDPDLALSHVVWPGKALAKRSAVVKRPTARPEELRHRALELLADGASWAQAAREVGVHKQTVGGWVKTQRGAAA